MPEFLTDEASVNRLVTSSQPAWILKHSSTCGISAAAYAQFLEYTAAHPSEPAGVVVVQTHRPLSNWIATRLGRVHQSPQLFLVRLGTVVWSVSHWSITAEAMTAAYRDAIKS